MASTTLIEQPRPAIFMMSYSDLARILGASFVIGLVSYALFVALERYVFSPMLCDGANVIVSRCSDRAQYAGVVSMILCAVLGLFATVYLRVYRPLLVVILVSVSLWGILTVAGQASWWMQTILVSLSFMFAYGIFSWIVQIRNFYFAIVSGIVLTILFRLLMLI